MKKIIKDIPLYYDENANCLICNLANIMKFHGYHEVETIFGLKWGFFYGRGNKNSLAKEEEGYNILSSEQSLAEDLFRFYGITLKRRSTLDAEKAWSIAKKSLDNNEPLIIRADLYYLGYHAHYQSMHGAHSFILNGYDEREDKAYIIDWYPSQFFKGAVSIKALKQARNSLNPKDPNNPQSSGFPIENSWFDIEYPSSRTKLDDNLIKKIILENIEVMLENKSENDYFQGIRGVRTFAEDVPGWSTCDNKDSLVTKMEKSFSSLWSIEGQRGLHSQFLSTISKRLGKPELEKISKELTKIAQGWRVVRYMFLKGSRKEPEAILPRIKTRLLDIADREEEMLLELKDIILSF